MLPCFVIPPGEVADNGASEALSVAGVEDSLLLTLGIERVREQQSLTLGIYGSADGASWDAQPLLEFPQKFYPGLSAVVLRAPANSSARYLRAQWKLARWGRGDKHAAFRLYLFAELLHAVPVEAIRG